MSQTASERPDASEPETSAPTRTGESLPSPETLRLVTDETRRAIVTTLWGADETPLRFTELRHRSGVQQSARFNYHLQELLGQCVHDTGDGYELTDDGERFVTAMVAVPPLDDLRAEPARSNR